MLTVIIANAGLGKTTAINSLVSQARSNKIDPIVIYNNEPDSITSNESSLITNVTTVDEVLALLGLLTVGPFVQGFSLLDSVDQNRLSRYAAFSGLMESILTVPTLPRSLKAYVTKIRDDYKQQIDTDVLPDGSFYSTDRPKLIVIDSLRPLLTAKGALAKGGLNRTVLESLTKIDLFARSLGIHVVATLNPSESTDLLGNSYQYVSGSVTNVIQILRSSEVETMLSNIGGVI